MLTSEGLKYLGLMRTTTSPALSPSEMIPVSVTPGGPSQRMGMPARANASSANFLRIAANRMTACNHHVSHRAHSYHRAGVARWEILAVRPSTDTEGGAGRRESAPDSGRLSRANDKVIGLLLLQHEPHAVHVVAGMPPVALCVQVPQQQTLLLAWQKGAQSEITCTKTCRLP